MSEMRFNIVEHIGALSDGTMPLELNIVGWNNQMPKYDLRRWKLEDGAKMPCKGITLSLGELKQLKVILNSMELLNDGNGTIVSQVSQLS